jgi:hypothetical protein
MITTYFQGGLGNQLFQIAAACSLAWDNEDTPVFDLNKSECPLQGRTAGNYYNNVYSRLSRTDTKPKLAYREPQQDYIKIPYREDMILVGYFQSEKYFSDHGDRIRNLFRPTKEIEKYIKQKYGFLLDSGMTSIHVRHGDYHKYKDTHPPCTIEYYEKALKEFPEDTKFLVISDTMEWCKQNFKGDRFYFVDSEEQEDYIDFYLMSKCDNHIIANSSFSWWAAWLNDNPNKKVVAPIKWFGESTGYSTSDLIPEGWIRV